MFARSSHSVNLFKVVLMTQFHRREFNIAAAVTGIATASAASAKRVYGANDRIRLGFIGVGNRGDQVLSAFLEQGDIEIAAVSDMYQPHLDFAVKKIQASKGNLPDAYLDYRKLLDRKDFDAVVICTPDHWHALQMVQACEAGKDVYVEKPLSLCVAEGRAMVNAARKNNRVVQCGIQRMSSPFAAEAADFIRNGGIGKVSVVRAFHVQNEWPQGIGRPEDAEPPEDFDWNQWLGPAPMQPYNKNRAFYRFRWFNDFSGGQLTNFGVHYLSQIHRSLGFDSPVSVAALGGKFVDFDNREVPDTMEVVWQYPGNTLVTFSQFNASGNQPAARPCEIEFRGTKGTLYFSTRGYEVIPEMVTPNQFAARSPINRKLEQGWRTGEKAMIEAAKVSGTMRDSDHARNFLDCVKSREKPSCDVEYGHRCTSAALIAGIALKTRSLLDWDADKELFTNHTEANKLLSYEYRKPHIFPK